MKLLMTAILGFLLCPFLNAQQASPQPKGVVPRREKLLAQRTDEIRRISKPGARQGSVAYSVSFF